MESRALSYAGNWVPSAPHSRTQTTHRARTSIAFMTLYWNFRGEFGVWMSIKRYILIPYESRVGLYSQNVSSAAMQLITTQIASRETHHLRMALQRWPLVELRLFMSQLMSTYMHDYEILYAVEFFLASCSTLTSSRQSASTGTAADQDGSAFIPIVDFIVLIAEQDDSTCQAVLDGGFLDLLLGIYTSCPILDSGGNRGPFTTLVSSCTSTLLILSKGSTNIESIIDHPVCTIWTQCGQLFHTPTTEDFISRRCTAWRRTDKSPVLRRVVTIYKVLLSMRNLNEPSATEIYNDLVEFSRSVALFFS